jgi:hypothetical protein
MLGCNHLPDAIKTGLYNQVVALREEISEKENLMEEYHQKKRKTHTIVGDLLSDDKKSRQNCSDVYCKCNCSILCYCNIDCTNVHVIEQLELPKIYS